MGSSINHVVKFLIFLTLYHPPFAVTFIKWGLCYKMVIWLTPSPSTVHVVYEWPLHNLLRTKYINMKPSVRCAICHYKRYMCCNIIISYFLQFLAFVRVKIRVTYTHFFFFVVYCLINYNNETFLIILNFVSGCLIFNIFKV